jgi:hypothetical protein
MDAKVVRPHAAERPATSNAPRCGLPHAVDLRYTSALLMLAYPNAFGSRSIAVTESDGRAICGSSKIAL